MKLDRTGLETTDPVSVAGFKQQFEHLKKALDNKLIDEDNFYNSSYKYIRNVSDAMTDAKHFEGNYNSSETEASGEASYDLKLALDGMIELLDDEYVVIDKRFEFSLSTRGAEMKAKDIGGDDVVSGIGTIATFAGTGATIGLVGGGVGAAIGAGVGAGVGIGVVALTWLTGSRPKKEVGQDIQSVRRLSIDIPFGFIYEDYSVTGIINSKISDDEYIIPVVTMSGSTSDKLYFEITSKNSATFLTDEFFSYNGNIQVLLKRKL